MFALQYVQYTVIIFVFEVVIRLDFDMYCFPLETKQPKTETLPVVLPLSCMVCAMAVAGHSKAHTVVNWVHAIAMHQIQLILQPVKQTKTHRMTQ